VIDEVKSMNPVTGEIAYKRVINTHINRFDPTGTVSLIDEIDGSETHLSVTAEHPFYHAERGWVHASKLNIDDLITEDDGGVLRVTKVTFNSNAPLNVTYNLEVADFHTYFVGEDGVLVHNGFLKETGKTIIVAILGSRAVLGDVMVPKQSELSDPKRHTPAQIENSCPIKPKKRWRHFKAFGKWFSIYD